MWDWITFAICVASLVPSVLLIGLLLRYLLKNSERRCFKDASEDCEILVSTTVRPAATREVLREFTRREVVGGSSQSNLQLTESPPEYSSNPGRNEESASEQLPPVYGSQSSVLSSVSALYGRLPSLPLHLNSLITSLDLLPDFASLPPPPTYDEAVRNEHVRC